MVSPHSAVHGTERPSGCQVDKTALSGTANVARPRPARYHGATVAEGTFGQLHLTAHAEGALIDVKVVPGSSRDRVAGPLGARLKVTVSRPAEKGAANKAVVHLLAEALGVPARDVRLTSGPARPEKTFLVRGLGPEEVRRRLAAR